MSTTSDGGFGFSALPRSFEKKKILTIRSSSGTARDLIARERRKWATKREERRGWISNAPPPHSRCLLARLDPGPRPSTSSTLCCAPRRSICTGRFSEWPRGLLPVEVTGEAVAPLARSSPRRSGPSLSVQRREAEKVAGEEEEQEERERRKRATTLPFRLWRSNMRLPMESCS